MDKNREKYRKTGINQTFYMDGRKKLSMKRKKGRGIWNGKSVAGPIVDMRKLVHSKDELDCFKGSVSRQVRPMLLYIIRKVSL